MIVREERTTIVLPNDFDPFVQSPQHKFSHFKNSQIFSCILIYRLNSSLSLFWNATFDIFCGERWTYFLTGKKVVNGTHCLKHKVSLWTKATCIGALNFVLFTCCLEAFNLTTGSCSLKKGHDLIFTATSLAFRNCVSTPLWIEISTRMETGRHRLIHRCCWSSAVACWWSPWLLFHKWKKIRFVFIKSRDRTTFLNLCEVPSVYIIQTCQFL